METKACNKCGQQRPMKSFQWCCDSYTGEQKWRRNTCNHCLYLRKIGKRLPQFTPATASLKL